MSQTKSVDRIKTHILCSKTFILDNRDVYDIRWKNIVQPDRPQMTIWRIRIACWILKTTDTRSEYIIIIAYPLQQWLQESA